MKVECSNCQVRINVPDDKIAPGQDFTFTCPKCKTKNTVQIPGQEVADDLTPFQEEEVQRESDNTDFKAESPLDNDVETAIGEFYEEGVELALICFDEGPSRDNLIRIATNLGYLPVLPESTRDALRRIKVTQFKAIMLHDNYDGHTNGIHPILRTLQPMNMSSRRRILLLLFGKDYQSLDSMTAFQLSVNAVVNVADEPKYDKIIQKAQADYERFYRVFFEVSRELGKM